MVRSLNKGHVSCDNSFQAGESISRYQDEFERAMKIIEKMEAFDVNFKWI